NSFSDYLSFSIGNIMKKILITVAVLCFFAKNYGQTRQKPVLNHIAHYVVALKTSTAFYTGIVGLDTIPEPFHDGRHTWLSVGPKSHLHLTQREKETTEHGKNDPLCIIVASVREFTAVLEKNNIPSENWAEEKNAATNRVDGIKQIYFRDPDGYWFENKDARE